MPSQWFYVRDKKRIGPVSWEQLQQLARGGQLAPTDMVLQEGSPRWQTVAELSGLLPPPPAKAAAPVTPTSRTPAPSAAPSAASLPPTKPAAGRLAAPAASASRTPAPAPAPAAAPVQRLKPTMQGVPRPADTSAAPAQKPANASASPARTPAPATVQRPKPTMQGVPRPADAPPAKAATPPPAAPASPTPPPPAPAPVVDQWLYVQNRIRHGPVTLAELKALVLAGKLLVSDMVFQTGWPRWKYASDVAELFPAPPPKAPALQKDEEDEDEDEFDDEEDDGEGAEADAGDDDEGPDEEIDVEPYLERAQQFRDRGDFAKALAEYEALIELLPDEPDGYQGLAWLWATCPNTKFRNATGAVAYAKRALGLEAEADEDEDSPLRIAILQKTLAAAQAEAGDFTAALATIELALPKAPAEEQARLTALRDLFRTKKPFREAPPAATPAR